MVYSTSFTRWVSWKENRNILHIPVYWLFEKFWVLSILGRDGKIFIDGVQSVGTSYFLFFYFHIAS